MLLVILHISCFLEKAVPTNERFLEKEKDCDSTHSQSRSKETSSKHSVTTKEVRQAHQTQQAPQTQPPETHQTSHQAPPKKSPSKKNHHNTPNLSLDYRCQWPPQKPNRHHRLALFFLLLSLPFLVSFSLFSFSFSDSFIHFLFSSIFSTRSSVSQLLRKFSSCIALYSRITSPSSLGMAPLSSNFSFSQSSITLFVPSILPSQIHLTAFCIPSWLSSSSILTSSSLWPLWLEPCHLQEFGFVSTSCHGPCPPRCLFTHLPKKLDNYLGSVHFPGIFMYLLLLPHLTHRYLLAPFRLMFHFFSFLIHENPLFFWFRLELFAILPFFHQTVEACCVHTPLLSLVEQSLLSFPP